MSARSGRRDVADDPLLKNVPLHEGYRVLDRIVLLARIGSGGMGVVYRGWHLKFGREVAVKVMRPSLAEDAVFVARFRREAQLSMAVTHQNVVRMYDVGSAHGLHFLVMEYVAGETVTRRVGRWGRMRQGEAVTLLAGVAAGLAEAHACGIVHRDIKPDNFLVARSGRVKLADLGLAKAAATNDHTRTGSSAILGTPQYMSPEQWRTPDVQPTADVWALGATFWFLVTGEHAVPADSGNWITKHPFPTLRERLPDMRSDLHALFERCVHPDPAERYRDAGALHDALLSLGMKDESLLREGDASPSSAIAVSADVPPASVLERIERLSTAAPPPAVAPAAAPAPAAVAAVHAAPRPVPRVVPPIVPPRRARVASGGRRGGAPGLLFVLFLLAVGAVVLALQQRGGGGGGDGDEQRDRLRRESLVRQIDPLVRPAAGVQHAPAPRVRVVVETPPPFLRWVRAGLQREDDPSAAFPPHFVQCDASGWERHLEGVPDGVWRLRCEACDESGITAELAPRRVVLDATGPTLAFGALQRGGAVSPAARLPLDVGADATAVYCALRADGAEPTWSPAVLADGAWSWLPAFAGEGAATLLARAVDAAGNESTASLAVVVDATPPQLDVPPPPRWTNAADVVIRGTATGAVRVRCEARGGSNDASPIEAAVQQGAFTVTAPLPDGREAEFAVVAYDAAGNASPPVAVRAQRHTVPPSLRWLAPDPAQPVPAGRTLVEIAADSAIDVATVLVGAERATLQDGRWVAPLAVPPGRDLRVEVAATDAAGNTAAPLVRYLNRDWQAMPIVPTGVGILMRRVPEGTFRMGPPASAVEVRIARPFWIAHAEVSRRQWRALGLPDPPGWEDGSDELPATNVTLAEAEEFCRLLTAHEERRGELPPGHRYALPTEAHWEYACRAGSVGDFAHGDDLAQLARFAVVGTPGLSPGVTKQANAWGVYDMHGNAAEWCVDLLEEPAPGAVDPVGTRRGTVGVRGGDHLLVPARLAAHERRSAAVDSRAAARGFRPELTVRPE